TTTTTVISDTFKALNDKTIKVKELKVGIKSDKVVIFNTLKELLSIDVTELKEQNPLFKNSNVNLLYVYIQAELQGVEFDKSVNSLVDSVLFIVKNSGVNVLQYCDKLDDIKPLKKWFTQLNFAVTSKEDINQQVEDILYVKSFYDTYKSDSKKIPKLVRKNSELSSFYADINNAMKFDALTSEDISGLNVTIKDAYKEFYANSY
ncbi:MAG: hypothetical protein U9Q38_07070, partial [Thermodesulfobacteriota bacterium]|nr:hypothetical protein [Thermodesulfobacteriota bacterium]